MADTSEASLPWLGSAAVLPNDPNLRLGVLPSGLRWAFQHNAYPPNRFTAHLIVNTGSINEDDNEQGIAHVLEHAVFLGTDTYPTPEALRKALTDLGMAYNADSNAYTDYRETVYTFQGPTGRSSDAAADKAGDQPSLPLPASDTTLPTVLHLLAQMAFHARLDAEPLENEKASVLSEAAMRNSVDYRVEVASVGLVHHEPGNSLPRRLPIGHARLIKGFTPDDLRAYYTKWYRPQWMTLVVSGPVETESAVACIQSIFGAESGPTTPAPALPTGIKAGEGQGQGAFDAIQPAFDATPHVPAFPNAATLVQHRFDAPPSRPIRIVQHPLLHACGLSITLKKPLASMQVLTRHHFVEAVTDIILASVFDGRIKELRAGRAAGCKAGQVVPTEDEALGASASGPALAPARPPRPVFNGIAWDDAPAGEEGCAYVELQVGSDMRMEAEADDAFDGGPADESELWQSQSLPPWAAVAWEAHGARGHVWQRATAVAVREAIRFARYGPCPNEFRLACQTFLRECRDRVSTCDSVDTDDIVQEIEDGLRSGSAMPSRVQELEWVAHVLTHDVTLEYAKARAAESYGAAEQAAQAAVSRLQQYASTPTDAGTDDTMGQAQGDAGAAARGGAAVADGVFDGLGHALTVFLCASGPEDTVTDPAADYGADNANGEGADGAGGEGVAAGAGAGAGPDAQPGLLDRLGVTGRRAKLRALMAGEAGTPRGDAHGEHEDEDEDEEGEEDEDMDGEDEEEDEAGEAASTQESEPVVQPTKRARQSDQDADGSECMSVDAASTSTGRHHVHGPGCAHGHGHGKGTGFSLANRASAGTAPPTPGRTGITRQLSSSGLLPAASSHLYRHSISPLEVLAAMAHGTVGIVPPTDILVPSHVVKQETLATRLEEAQRAHAAAARLYGYSPVSSWPEPMRSNVDASSTVRIEPGSCGGQRAVETVSGITTLVLSNGLTLTYIRTRYEPAYVGITLIARGGKLAEGRAGWVPGIPHAQQEGGQNGEGAGEGPYFGPLAYGPAVGGPGCHDATTPWITPGAIGLGLSTLVASGAAGLTAEALERVESVWGISSSANAGFESVRAGFAVVAAQPSAGSDPSTSSAPTPTAFTSPVSRALELLHAYLASPSWDEAAFDREKDDFVSEAEASGRSLDTLAAAAVSRSMCGGHDDSDGLHDGFDIVSKGVRESLTLQQCKTAIQRIWGVPGNMQVVVAGDIVPEEVEAAVLAWLGPLLPPPASSLPRVLVVPPQPAPAPGTVVPFVWEGQARGAAIVGPAGFAGIRLPYLTTTGGWSYPDAPSSSPSPSPSPSAPTPAPVPGMDMVVATELTAAAMLGEGGKKGGVKAKTGKLGGTAYSLSHRCLPPAIPPTTWVRPFAKLPVALLGRVVRLPDADPTPRCLLYVMVPSVGKLQAIEGVEAVHGFDTAAFFRSRAAESPSSSSSPWPALRSHPMYMHRSHFVLSNILSNRMYRRLRDKTGLCYAVSYDLSAHDSTAGGWEELTCTPTPVAELPPRALAHALAVLRDFYTGVAPITESEVDETVKPLVQSLLSDTGRNEFWGRAAAGLFGVQGGYKLPGHFHELAAYYACFTVEELRHGLKLLASRLPYPLPLHVAVGISGSLSFLPDGAGSGSGSGSGGRPGKAGAGSGSKAVASTAGSAQAGVLPIPESKELRQEWSAFLERVIRDGVSVAL